MSKPTAWSLKTVFLWGAAIGAAYVVGRETFAGDPNGAAPLATLIPVAIGGAIGGAFLAGLVAYLRNLFIR
jgi:formate/nitrite transporter FocA (FNT family)